MQAFIKKTKDNILIIHLKGEVDFASTEPFHETCMKKLTQKNIIFNLKDLHFVGSDGLSPFLDTMKQLGQCSQLRFCCVGSEFRRLFANSEEIHDKNIYDDEHSATISFLPPKTSKPDF